MPTMAPKAKMKPAKVKKGIQKKSAKLKQGAQKESAKLKQDVQKKSVKLKKGVQKKPTKLKSVNVKQGAQKKPATATAQEGSQTRDAVPDQRNHCKDPLLDEICRKMLARLSKSDQAALTRTVWRLAATLSNPLYISRDADIA